MYLRKPLSLSCFAAVRGDIARGLRSSLLHLQQVIRVGFPVQPVRSAADGHIHTVAPFAGSQPLTQLVCACISPAMCDLAKMGLGNLGHQVQELKCSPKHRLSC